MKVFLHLLMGKMLIHQRFLVKNHRRWEIKNFFWVVNDSQGCFHGEHREMLRIASR